MDGPNYLKLLQTGKLDPSIPSHRKALEDNLGPLGKLLSELGIGQQTEQVATETVAEVPAEPVLEVEEAPKPRGRRKKDSNTSPTE